MHASLRVAALAGAVTMLGAAAAPSGSLAPSAVLATAQTLDGKPVSVSGKIKDYVVHRPPFIGTITSYELCDDACLPVLIKSDPQLANGQTTTATGTFHVLLTFYGHKVPNVITVGF